MITNRPWILIENNDSNIYIWENLKERKLGRPSGRWEDDITIDLEEIGLEVVELTHVAHNVDQGGLLCIR